MFKTEAPCFCALLFYIDYKLLRNGCSNSHLALFLFGFLYKTYTLIKYYGKICAIKVFAWQKVLDGFNRFISVPFLNGALIR